MPFENRVSLSGSEKQPLPDSHVVGEVKPDDIVSVTVVLRRKGQNKGNEAVTQAVQRVTHAQFASLHGADESEIQIVEEFAHHAGLTVVESSAAKRRVILTGKADDMMKAFNTQLKFYRLATAGPTFRGRTGTLSIPTELQDVVLAVLGLDTRPVAKPHIRRKKKAAPTSTFTPPQVAALYDFPKGLDGSGQTVAIIELGGGYKASDLSTYFSGLGIKQPKVSAVSVDGGKNTPGSDADGEVLLDIEVAGSIAPGASYAVYFAPNTDKGFIDAITDAAHDTTRKPSVISISWGGAEDSWTAQSQNALNAALQDAATLGVTVTAASGDNGSTDGATDKKLHVDFPASSPYALACGGTALKGSGTNITSETVWNETANNEGATGGGVSTVFTLPTYQSSAGVPKNPETNFVGRGVPDVAGNADPSTGYQVLVDGQSEVVGGTSAVAPLWAALIALINQKLGKPVGFANPTLYSMAKSAFHDISSGNNDDGGLGYYSSGSGWDPCTGLGSPDGAALLKAFQSSSSATSGR